MTVGDKRLMKREQMLRLIVSDKRFGRLTYGHKRNPRSCQRAGIAVEGFDHGCCDLIIAHFAREVLH
jgi:hypothetical protein